MNKDYEITVFASQYTIEFNNAINVWIANLIDRNAIECLEAKIVISFDQQQKLLQ